MTNKARASLSVILSRSRGEPRHDTPGENRAVTSAQRTFNECGGFLLRSEVSNANEVEGSRTASKIPRPLSCGRGQAAWRLLSFCNRHDARVRVQRGFVSRVGFSVNLRLRTLDIPGGWPLPSAGSGYKFTQLVFKCGRTARHLRLEFCMDPARGFISVDDHVLEHPQIWTSRMSRAKWGERIPHVQRQSDGTDRWLIGEETLPLVGRGSVGACMADQCLEPERWEDVPKACCVPSERLRAMDADNVGYSALYPTVAAIAGETFGRLEDPGLELACVQAYNDWLLEEWAAA